MDAIPVVHFDTAGFRPEARVQAWASILPWYELGRRDDLGEFNVLADAWLVEAMVVSVTRMPPVWLQRTVARSGADGRDDFAVVVGDAPWRLTVAGAAEVLVEPGDVCVLDNSKPFRVETAAGEYFILNMPRPALDDRRLGPPPHGSLFRHTLAMVFGDFLRGLRGRLPTLTPGQAPAVGRALRDLLVSCLAAGAEPPRGAEAGSSTIQRAGWYIDTHLSTALTVRDIARSLGVSRSSLYRIFAEAGGVERFVLRRRLSRAHAMLTHVPGRRPGIAEVALATGFASTTHFSRVFKSEFGITPTAARAARSVVQASMNAQEIRRFQSWFAGTSRTRQH